MLNERAQLQGKTARVALRINPGVDAQTHHYITTGLEENKFGINPWQLDHLVARMKVLPQLKLIGIHFHIGSQITHPEPFRNLCVRINDINQWFQKHGIFLKHINAGGGLGINYQHPDEEPIPDFEAYFRIFHQFLQLKQGQQLHFELGRALTAQCGTLVSRVLYIKEGLKNVLPY